MASNRSKSSPKRETRQALTFEMALQLCPHEGVAENVATAFGLIAPDYDAIRAEHATALKRLAEAFEILQDWQRAAEQHGDRRVLEDCAWEQIWILEQWGRTSEARQLDTIRREHFADQMAFSFDQS